MKTLRITGIVFNATFPDRIWTGLKCCGMAVALAGWLELSPGVRAQSFNFNNGNDNGWTHLDLSAAGLPPATYSFPSDGSGGKAYRIQAAAPPLPDFGPARAFSYPANDYNRFTLGVDVVSWNTNVDQAFGLVARATSIGLGSSDGYVMNYNVTDGDLQINLIFGEAPSTISETHLPLAPSSGPYRWVFSGYGENLLGQVFLPPDLENPIGSVAAIDSQNSSGKSGLFIFSRAVVVTDVTALTDATFDNYDASAPPADSLRATVVVLAPAPRQQITEPLPLIQAAILDRETFVQTDSIRLWVDSVEISTNSFSVTNEVVLPNPSTPFGGATVSYQPASLPGTGNTHTNRLVYSDVTGFRTNEWTFTIVAAVTLQSSPTLSPANFQPEGGAIVDAGAHTITIAQSGAQRFYRLSGASSTTISSIHVNGNNVVLNYQ